MQVSGWALTKFTVLPGRSSVNRKITIKEQNAKPDPGALEDQNRDRGSQQIGFCYRDIL
jgi:hypothetical protein